MNLLARSAITQRSFGARRVCRAALLGLAVLLGQPLPLAAQTPLGTVAKQVAGGATGEAGPASEPVSVAGLQQRLADTQGELAAIDSPGRLAAGAPAATPTAELQLRLRMLRLLVFAYRQHLNALGNLAEQQKFAADGEARRRDWTGPEEKPPYSILLADRMRTELQANLLNLRSEEGRRKILAAQMEGARESLAKVSERARLAQEVVESAAPAELAGARWRRDLAALEVRALGAYLESLAAQDRAVEASVAELGRIVEFDRRRIAEAEKAVAFRAADLERLKADIDERRVQTVKDLELATRERDRLSVELDRSSAAVATAQQQLAELQTVLAGARKASAAADEELAKAGKPEGFLSKVNPFRGRTAKADADKRRAELAAVAQRLAAAQEQVRGREREQALAVEHSRNAVHAVEALNIALVTLDMRRDFWDLRYAAMSGEPGGQPGRRNTIEDGRRLQKLLGPAIDLLRAKLEIVSGQLAEQQNLLRLAADSGETAFRKRLLELLGERERLYLQAFAEVEGTRHLLQRWFEDEAGRTSERSTGERARNWFGQGGEWLQSVWNFELFAVADSIVVDGRTISGTRGVTVAKVVEAILIVVVGYLLIALLARFAMALAVRRGRLEETGARIARKWVLAVTLVVLLLLALDAVKIPLTAFAFLGGAIAIGAGFGMQTLLKNLISGVMLLLERPFKPRDIVEVGGIRGEVTDINVRSCTIRDVNGIETLVPNSTFLEQNVTNWTLSSRQVRYTLNVGVAYGSPVRRVAELLQEVAARHNLVLKEPAPEVLFMDFADNALQFALYVWLEVGPGRRGGTVVLSDLRFMIDASFAEHGIAIPFPQRDVHLAAAAPLPVRVVAADAGSAG